MYRQICLLKRLGKTESFKKRIKTEHLLLNFYMQPKHSWHWQSVDWTWVKWVNDDPCFEYQTIYILSRKDYSNGVGDKNSSTTLTRFSTGQIVVLSSRRRFVLYRQLNFGCTLRTCLFMLFLLWLTDVMSYGRRLSVRGTGKVVSHFYQSSSTWC